MVLIMSLIGLTASINMVDLINGTLNVMEANPLFLCYRHKSSSSACHFGEAKLARFWKGGEGICPPKVEVFAWQLSRGRVLVKSVVQAFGFIQNLSLLCPLCNVGIESVDHLFLLFPWSWKLWNSCMSWLGGVLRNSVGRILCSFSSSFGIQDAISAELMANHKACWLVASKQVHLSYNVSIVSDSKIAVSWIHDENFGSFKHVDLLYDIRNFLLVMEGLKVRFLPRDTNSLADGLAKSGSSLVGDRVEWDSF
ncbi:hypothetical protein Ddye_015044 [Dipteronia dyeriana]|uniref:RNase H type-1 domain-containing protein n=1 Tax=Dipteronia dyeriana TaxID=168575 RepID=A0AAD9U423_9ROSI|nr:hypothetical protein Ddye_015044 [Dipteronia dyeriana]